MFDVFGIGKALFGDKGLVGSVTDVLKSSGIIKDPEMEMKVRQALMDFESKNQETATKRIEAVNKTMQAEAKSDSWIQRSWRPCVGFTFIALVLNNYFFMAYSIALGAKFGLTITAIVIPENVWMAMLAILGVSAYTRGKEKEAREKK